MGIREFSEDASHHGLSRRVTGADCAGQRPSPLSQSELLRRFRCIFNCQPPCEILDAYVAGLG